MEVVYDKAALHEYMDQVGAVRDQMQRHQDESLNLFYACKQQYNRIYTKLEEVVRRAYNQMEDAESMRRSAELEYEVANRTAESAEDEDTQNAALQRMWQAQAMRTEADEEYAKASIAYSKASDDLRNLSELWESHAPALEAQAHRVEDGMASFLRLVAKGNSDLGEYMSILDKAQAELYGDSPGAIPSGSGSVPTSTSSSAGNSHNISTSFITKAGNTLGLALSAGVASIVMRVAGKEHSFPHTKSGAAKAYRTAAQSGDQEMIMRTNALYSSFGSAKASAPQNQQYVAETLSELEAGLPGTFDREMVIAGSQERKLNSPVMQTSSGTARGSWEGTTFILDNDYVPEKYNDDGLTIAQIKQNLRGTYGIDVGGIPYVNGVADFSSISVASVPTADIVTRSTGMSSEEYASLSQHERTAIFQKVFSDATDGKSKRERNFDYADQIASERQIPIPGLPEGYTGDDLKKWRSEHKFSWDEQVSSGYNLVPTIIHGNVSHTGLVSTSGSAHTYLEQRETDMKLHPEKYSWDENDAPISILEALNKKE